jgi:hypothetical protein
MFPEVINNNFNGKKIALWVFGLITVMTIGRSLVHIFARDGDAQSIATIPLDSYTQASADTVVLIFSLWGLSQLLMGFVYVIALWKYRSLIPFLYLLLFIEYAGRILLGLWKPIVLAGTAPGSVGNYIMAPLALGMTFLSQGNPTKPEG